MIAAQSNDSKEKELTIINESINYSLINIAADFISTASLLIEKQKLIDDINNVESNLPDARKLRTLGSVLTLSVFAYALRLTKYNLAQPLNPLDTWKGKTTLLAVLLSISSSSINLTNLFSGFNKEQQEELN